MDAEDCVKGWYFKCGARVHGIVGSMCDKGTLVKREEHPIQKTTHTWRTALDLHAARNEVYHGQILVFKIITTPHFTHKSMVSFPSLFLSCPFDLLLCDYPCRA
jgi:hypothetical protein